MADIIEFDPVDSLSAGAFGVPGERTFRIQARKGQATLSVLVEKEQVALLAVEAEQFPAARVKAGLAAGQSSVSLIGPALKGNLGPCARRPARPRNRRGPGPPR